MNAPKWLALPVIAALVLISNLIPHSDTDIPAEPASYSASEVQVHWERCMQDPSMRVGFCDAIRSLDSFSSKG